MFSMPTQDETTTPKRTNVIPLTLLAQRTFFSLLIHNHVQFLHQTIQFRTDECHVKLEFRILGKGLNISIIERIVEIQFEHGQFQRHIILVIEHIVGRQILD